MKLLKIGVSTIVPCLMLGACSSPPRLQTLTATAPPNLVVNCQRIEQPALKNMGDLIQFTNSLIGQYGECSDKHDALVRAWPK